MKTILRVLLYGVLLFFVLALVLPAIGFGGLKVTGTLLFGWIGFLRRVLPAITTNWNGIGMVVVCSVLIVAGMQWLCGWVYTHNMPAQKHRWRWQWSLSLYAALWLLFVAAMGITGFVHQLGWLISSKEPLIVERKYRGMMRILMREACAEIVTAAEDADWDLAVTRKEFLADSERLTRRRQPIEDLHVLFIQGNEGKLTAAILFPRDAVEQQKTGFILVLNQTGNWQEEHPMNDFPAVLARFAAK